MDFRILLKLGSWQVKLPRVIEICMTAPSRRDPEKSALIVNRWPTYKRRRLFDSPYPRRGSVVNSLKRVLVSALVLGLSVGEVLAQDTVAPTVASVQFSNALRQSGDTYALGNVIEVRVRFTERVVVEGEVQLALTIGSEKRQAVFLGYVGPQLNFAYEVQATDQDGDGISIEADALTLNGGRIRDLDSNDAELDLKEHAIANDSTLKVDGSQDLVPTVRSVVFSLGPQNPYRRDTYFRGDTIRLYVYFDEMVMVTGTPSLELTIGSERRKAVYTSGSGDFNGALIFGYEVQATDLDTDGVTIEASALTLNGGSIRDGTGNAADLSLSVGASSSSFGPRRVDGSIDPFPTFSGAGILYRPQSGDTFTRGEAIVVSLRSTEELDVFGSPQLALTVGSEKRQATYEYKTRTSLYFAYEVQATDRDIDGISIEGDALSLNGGSIRDRTGNDVELSLSRIGRGDRSGYKVDGGQLDATAPTVSRAYIYSRPPDRRTYLLGETVEVLVAFSENVEVTGNPQLELTIGSTTRQAVYHRELFGRVLFFRYEVQAGDLAPDGIRVGADALNLNGGSIRDGSGNDAELSLGTTVIPANPFSQKVDGGRVDSVAPMVTDMWITPRSSSGDTHYLNSTIDVTVLFSEAVRITGSPQLALTIGSVTRHAEHRSGLISQLQQVRYSSRLQRFRYQVQAGDLDADGISAGEDALNLNGGTIQDAAGNDVELSLGSHAISNDPDHKVDGSVVPAPTVSSVFIRTDPQDTGAPDTYVLGEEIVVVVQFDEAVTVVGHPQLTLTIGSERRPVAYSRATANWLYFLYTVQQEDLDTDGISVEADALILNGGSIRDGAGKDAKLSLGSHAIADHPGHKVDGGILPSFPIVTRVESVSNPQIGDTYVLGETIWVRVQFSEMVIATRTVRLALTIGSERRLAIYWGTDTHTLQFAYRIQATDLDADGFTIEANALTLEGGSIRDLIGNDALLSLSSDVIADVVGHKVDGSIDPPPTFLSAAIRSSPQMGQTYVRGETIVARIRFSEDVEVVGSPQLTLTIGSESRQATFVGTVRNGVYFTYEVQAADHDIDGISIGADVLSLNGGSIRDRTGNDAEFRWSSPAFANDPGHKVDGGTQDTIAPKVVYASVARRALDFFTYVFGQTIRVRVRFNEKVEVKGNPHLALTIGTETRQATYAYSTETVNGLLHFVYQVQADDLDANGISIGVDALTLSGGSIRDAAGNDAELSLGDHAVVDDWSSKVDGVRRVDFPATVRDVWIIPRSPRGDTYLLGDIIEVQVLFGERVGVTDNPQLALTIGPATRQATYEYTFLDRLVHFRYEVQAGDFDGDGISAGVNALNLNGGSIQDWASNDVELSLGTHAILNDPNSKVDGSIDPAPEVRSVMILTSSQDAATPDTYILGEKTVVGVLFSEEVAVTGTPQLTLAIGSERRRASYESTSGNWLYFSYRVQQEDLDADGISVEVDALTLNGGSIRDVVGNDASLSLGSHTIAEDVGHKVDGSHVAIPTGDWSPDHQSGASLAIMEGKATVTFRHGGRIEEDGFTYTCMSSGGCKIEGRRISMGTVMVSETAGETELMLAGVAELVDDQTEFQGKTYNGYELEESTVTFRSVAGETTRISFLDPDGDLVFVDFSSDDPATEMVITLEGFSGTLEESPYDQPDTLYARGLATVTVLNPTELTWLRVVSLGNHVDRVDLALIEDNTFAGAVDGIADIKAVAIEGDTFAGEVDGIADIKVVVIEGGGRIGAIDAANANFVGSSGEIGIDAAGTVVKRALSIGDITPSEGALPVLRISGTSLDAANAGEGETVITEIQIAGGDLREATGALQIDTGEVVYRFPIVAVDGERSIRNSELRPDLGDGILEAVTDTFVANPEDYFVTDEQTTGVGEPSE